MSQVPMSDLTPDELHLPDDLPAGVLVRITVERLTDDPIIDPLELAGAEPDLIPVADSVPPLTALWTRLSALRDQAAREGALPAPMSWDDILAEVQRRRGEQNPKS